MDQLFSTQPLTVQADYFAKILDFLFKALALPKQYRIVSLQALDALTTQLSETALCQQIQVNFDGLIQTLAEYNMNLNLQSYFDFLAEFIQCHYQNFT
jgi:hypothetical protein